MKSRIDVVTGKGIIGLEIRKYVDFFSVDRYYLTVGSMCCFLGKKHAGNATEYFWKLDEAKEYMKNKALASVPVYLFVHVDTDRLSMKLDKQCGKGERPLSDDISGFLFVTEQDIEEWECKKDALDEFYRTAKQTVTEFTCVLNRDVYEFEAFFNYQPLASEKHNTVFYGNYDEVFEEIMEEFSNTVEHPAFMGDGAAYLFEHIEHGHSFTDLWVMSPDEQANKQKYLKLACNQLEKELYVCIETGDTVSLADIKRSYGELALGLKYIPALEFLCRGRR